MLSKYFSLLHYVLLTLYTCAITIPEPLQAQSQLTEIQRGVPFITVRNRTDSDAADEYFGEDRGDPRAGWCDIGERSLGIPPSVTEALPFRVPEEILRVEAVREEPVGAVLDTLETTTADSPPLLYTHGFYIDFEKGCRRATVFQENSGLQDSFFWFSWPSDGALLNYTRDEADLYWSVPDLVRVIADLDARFGPGQLNVAGHSLGARGMVLALNDIAARRPDTQLGELVLLAPDIDFGIFQKLLPKIRPIVRGITVYVAEADRPLALSATVHGYPRLGETGNDTASLNGVEVIDLSDLPVRSPTGHLYHVYNEVVGDDLHQLLKEGKRANQRRNMTPSGGNTWLLQPKE